MTPAGMMFLLSFVVTVLGVSLTLDTPTTPSGMTTLLIGVLGLVGYGLSMILGQWNQGLEDERSMAALNAAEKKDKLLEITGCVITFCIQCLPLIVTASAT